MPNKIVEKLLWFHSCYNIKNKSFVGIDLKKKQKALNVIYLSVEL